MIVILGANHPVGQTAALAFAQSGGRISLVDTDADALETTAAHHPEWIEVLTLRDVARDLAAHIAGRWDAERIALVLNLLPLQGADDISAQMRNLTAIVQTTLRGLVAGQGSLINVVERAADPLGFVAHGMHAALREASAELAAVTADKGMRVHCVTVPAGQVRASVDTIRLLTSPSGRSLRSTVVDVEVSDGASADA